MNLDAGEKAVWKIWEEWDSKRYERDVIYFTKIQRKNRLSEVVEDPVTEAKVSDRGKKIKIKHEDGTMLNVSPTEPKGKRALEEYNNQAETTTDVSKSSFHVPKRRKGDN